ncbi:MAG TPA: outer membrane protein assembly factor BamB, partial [Gammaproteobacteria bacterium]|nr:outer membrane protein assembly factor BamB [Gammaproteobacteria bacterium]
MKIQKSLFFSIFICLLLSSCSTFWEKDNSPPPSPLVQFEPKVKPRKLWDTRINFGMNHEDLKFNPLLIHDELIILSQAGTITSLNKNTGKIQWTMEVKAKVSSGLAMNDQLLVVGTKNGEVLAFSTHDRKPLWTAHTESEILATPVLSQQLVIVKSIDGKISAFSIAEGRLIWRHQAIEPNFILRGASTPQLTSTAVVVGYANGKVEKLALKDGHALWTEALARADGAFAIQRMIDIDANPLISNNKIFAASYQGKLAALHLSKGSILWDQDLSSYVDLAADENLIYVSDADSHIQAFDQQTGRLIWKQTQLEARHITGPVLVGPYLVVGDG